MTIDTGDSVTFEYTGRLDDGTVFDTSRQAVAEETGLSESQPDRDFEPLTVEVGSGQLIEGLDGALIGLEAGDAPTVAVPPSKAYGEWTDQHVQSIDAEEFRGMTGGELPDEGAYIETQQGELAEIVRVDDEVVEVDFNHALAGKTLEFDLEVVAVD